MSLAQRKITPTPSSPDHDPLPDVPLHPDLDVMKRKERIGDMLRQRREERGEDMYRIAEELCIRPTYLQALEGSHYHALPADAYVIGFLRTYANYLDIDGQMAIDRYRMEMAGRRAKPALLMPEPISQSKMPTTLFIVGGIVVSFLIYGLWYGLSSGDRSNVAQPQIITASTTSAISSPPQATAQTPTTASTAGTGIALPVPGMPDTTSVPTPPVDQPSGIKPAPALPPAMTATHVMIRSVQPSWILVSDSHGKILVDRVLKSGESYAVPDQKGLRLTTGNGSGLILSIDGVDLPHLSTEQSKIQRDIPLDTESLRNLSLPLAD